MRTLQRELEDLRTQRSREAEHARDDQAELDVLRAKCERLESGGMLGGVRMFYSCPNHETHKCSIGRFR